MLTSGVALASLRQCFRLFVGNELAVCENLERNNPGCPAEEIEQLLVHERFAAENPEKAVSVLLCVLHDLVEVIEIDLHLRFIDVYPAALAAEVATVQN